MWMSLSGPARAWPWNQSNISGETWKCASTPSNLKELEVKRRGEQYHIIPKCWLGIMHEWLQWLNEWRLCTALVICWRSLWRWGPAGQHRFSDVLVTHCLVLVLSFFCSLWRPGAHHHHLFSVQVWGIVGLLEVLMVVWKGVQGGCGVYFQTYNKTH